MNWIKGKSYKTVGGWEAMYLGREITGDERFAHYEQDGTITVRDHRDSGRFMGDSNCDVTSEEWQEPVTHVVYLNVYGGFMCGGHRSKENADRCADRDGRLDCIKITYVQGQSVKAEIV